MNSPAQILAVTQIVQGLLVVARRMEALAHEQPDWFRSPITTNAAAVRLGLDALLEILSNPRRGQPRGEQE